MPAAPELPDLFKRSVKPGRVQTPQLEVVWSEAHVDLRGPALQLNMPWGEFAALQVSRSIKARRRLLRAPVFVHMVHVELRASRGARVRLSAEIDRPEELDGLPFLEGSGDLVPADALLDLVAAARAQRVSLVEWDDNDARLPTDEIERRAREREQRAKQEQRREQEAEALHKEKQKAAEKTGKGSGCANFSIIAAIVGLIGVVIGLGNTCTWIVLHSSVDRVQAVAAVPDDPDRLIVLAYASSGEDSTSRVLLVNGRTGQIERKANWADNFWSGSEEANLLGVSRELVWLCGREEGIAAWDLKTLEPRLELNALKGDPKLRDIGLDETDWFSCNQSDHFIVRPDGLLLLGNEGNWYRLGLDGSLKRVKSAPPREEEFRACGRGAPRSWARLDDTRNVRWDGNEKRAVLEVRGEERRPIGSDRYVGVAWLEDAATCAAMRPEKPESLLFAYQTRLNRGYDHLARVSLKGKTLWDIPVEPELGNELAGATLRGNTLVLVWGASSTEVYLAGYDIKTGKLRWKLTP